MKTTTKSATMPKGKLRDAFKLKSASIEPTKYIDVNKSSDSNQYEVSTQNIENKKPLEVVPTVPIDNPEIETKTAMQTVDKTIREYPNFFAGLAPLAVGALLGDFAEGAKHAGNFLIDDYTTKRNANLKSRNTASSGSKGSYQFKNIENPDGSIGMIRLNTRTGEAEPTQYTAGFKRSVTTDPTTGEKASYSGSKVIDNVAALQSSRPDLAKKYTVKQQEEMLKLRDSLMGDKEVQSERKAIASSGRALSLLASGNPIADQGISTIFPRMFGEVGNLAVAERAAFTGSPALIRKFESLRAKYQDGSLTDKDRSDLMEVAEVMQEYSRKSLKNYAEAYIKSQGSVTGYDSKSVLEPLVNTPNISANSVVKKAKSKSPIKGKPKLMKQPRAGGGYHIFELKPNGKYEYLESRK